MTVKKTAPKSADKEKEKKIATLLWISENPKILTTIARSIEPPVSQALVSMILSGKRLARGDQGKKVLKALRKAGAPV